MSRNRVIVAAGSNIDPHENLRHAQKLLEEKYRIVEVSSLRETLPFGKTDQPNFFDRAFLVETDLEAPAFCASLKEIEHQLGRRRSPETKFGPLTIDLDILVWNGEVMDPELYRHEFLRAEALEVEPGLKIEKEKIFAG